MPYLDDDTWICAICAAKLAQLEQPDARAIPPNTNSDRPLFESERIQEGLTIIEYCPMCELVGFFDHNEIPILDKTALKRPLNIEALSEEHYCKECGLPLERHYNQKTKRFNSNILLCLDCGVMLKLAPPSV